MDRYFGHLGFAKKITIALMSVAIAAMLIAPAPVASAATALAKPTPTATVSVEKTATAVKPSSGFKTSGNYSSTLAINSPAGVVHISLGIPLDNAQIKPLSSPYQGGAQISVRADGIPGANGVSRSNLSKPVAVTIRSTANTARWSLQTGSNLPAASNGVLAHLSEDLSPAAVKLITGSITVTISPKGKPVTSVTYQFVIGKSGQNVILTLMGSNNTRVSKTFTTGKKY
jgi:hypothetical protein